MTQPLSSILHLDKKFCKKLLRWMRIMKRLIANIMKRFLVKIDPHFLLLILVIVFFFLLFAAENVIKYTLIPQ